MAEEKCLKFISGMSNEVTSSSSECLEWIETGINHILTSTTIKLFLIVKKLSLSTTTVQWLIILSLTVMQVTIII